MRYQIFYITLYYVSSCDGSSFVQPSTLEEPASSPSSVVSRQLSVVRPPLGCRSFPLNPCATPFLPRVQPTRDAPFSSAPALTPQPPYLPVHPLEDLNDTVTQSSPLVLRAFRHASNG